MSTAPTDNKMTKVIMNCDFHHEKILLAVLQRFSAFSANDPQTLQTIADKELVTQAIDIDLLIAEETV